MALDFIKFVRGIIIKNGTDLSKQISIQVDPSAATNTTVVLASAQQANETLLLPDADGGTDTLVARNSTDTLTKKTIDGNDNTLLNIPGGSVTPGINAANIADGSVSNTEFQQLDGVTSNIQGQLNAVAGSAITGLTGDVLATGPGVATATITNGAITNAKVDSGAQIDRTKLALGLANGVVINDSFGNMTDELRLSKVRGGSAQDNSGLTFPSVGTLATTNQPEVFTNKTIGDALTFTQIATPVAPAAGLNKIYTKSDNRAYILNQAGQEQRIGNDGGGTKNYLTQYRNNTGNGDFETNSTIGWSRFNTTVDAITRLPNQASGSWTAASGAFTFTATPANISGSYSGLISLSGASTVGDMAISDGFSIDDSDKNKEMEFSINYRIVSGLANLSLSTTSTSSLGVAIYDVTNNTWIKPSNSFNFLNTNPVGNIQGRFTSSATGNAYRIAVYFPNASAGAFALGVDDFEVGPVEQPNLGAILSDDIGRIDAFSLPATTQIPGYLYCNGAAVSRVVYAALFAKIGISHGSGDGSTTFNLPDYRGGFLRGQSNGSGKDPDAASRTALNAGGNTGDTVGSQQPSQYGSHTHTDSGHRHNERIPAVGGPASFALITGSYDPNVSNSTAFLTDFASANIQANGGNETRPYNINVNYFIKYTSTLVPSNTVTDDNVGRVDAFAVAPSLAIPGYLYCNGAAVSRVIYADLFNKIGITHGSGDGSTTFNLPDYRGRFLRGQNDSTGRDPDSGSRTAMNAGGNTGDNVGSIQSGEYQSHSHGINDPGHSHTQVFGSPSGFGVVGGSGPFATSQTSTNTTGITVQTNGGNETRPLNATVNYFIRHSATVIANDPPKFSASAHAVAAVSAGVPFDLKFSTTEQIKNFTYNVGTGELTCNVPGNYDITWMGSVVGTVGTTQATVSILVKNAADYRAGTRVFGTGGSNTYTSVGSLASVPLSASDVLKIAINCDANVNVQTSGLYNYISVIKV